MLTLGLFGGGYALGQANGRTATYPAGFNLVAGPLGTDFSNARGPLSTLQPGDDAYETIEPEQGVQAGYGYWAYFDSPATVTLATSGPVNRYSVTVPAGQFILVGNPTADVPVAVEGADAVYTYDPVRGYRQTTVLNPGQGAWAYSASVSVIYVTPMVRRVNTGGADYLDAAGNRWDADYGHTGIDNAATTSATIAGTSDQPLYQSERWGPSFDYSFYLPNGRYAVILKFTEIYWPRPGQRVFTVAINGQPVLTHFDILTLVPPNTALDRSFSVTVTDDVLDIAFAAVVDNAKISAIEIVPSTGP